MKLNLLPTSVSTGAGSRVAYVIAVVIIAAAIFGAVQMKGQAQSVLDKAQADVNANQADSQKVVDIDQEADNIMLKSTGPLLNVQLANAMLSHNKVYPDFYDSVIKSIPGYFRLTSLSATPLDDHTCTVTMEGTIASFQQYADLMLALLRIKGAKAVSRSGYQLNDEVVPPLVEQDQHGYPVAPNHQRLTDDPMQRLDVKIAEASHTDFVGQGNFGMLDHPMQRFAMPKESQIRVAVVVEGVNLMTPHPRQTLSQAGAAFAASGATTAPTSSTTTPTGAPGAPPMSPPGVPGGRA